MASAFNPRSVIADVNVEAPDFGMLAKAAVSVQNRYLEGFNKYKSTITSLLNTPISSDDNVKFRADYFKKIDGYLNNLQGIDFSNPANVSVASNLMQPLVKDQEFLADMNFNLMQNAEMRKLDSAKMSTDEKVRSQYSPILEKAMKYNYMDMKNAKRGDGSIMKVGVQKYLPFANLNNVLNDAAKAMDLKMSPDPVVTGQWIVTDKFGNNAIPALTQWARQQLGDAYDEQILVTNKVQIRDQLENIMIGDPNLTKEQAYQQIANDRALGIYNNYEEYKTSLDGGIVSIDRQIADIKSRMNNKIPKGSQEEQYIAQLKNLKTQYQKELADSAANRTGKEQDLQTAFNQFMQNPEYALMPLYKDNLAKQWATTYAQTHAERKIEVNPYGLEAARFANDVKLKKMDQDFQMMKMEAEANLKFKSDMTVKMMEMGMLTQPTEAPGQPQTFDPLSDYLEQAYVNEKGTRDGYFSREVLEVATSSSNLASDVMPYDQLRKSLDQFFKLYTVNKANPSPEFASAYRDVITLARKLNPNLTLDEAKNLTPGKIMTMITVGVNNRYNGQKDPNTPEGKRYVMAKEALMSAQQASENYSANRRKLNDNFKNLSEEARSKFDIDVFRSTGALRFREGVTEEEKTAIYNNLFPGYQPRGSQSATGFTTPNIAEDKFDFSAWGEAISQATYASDGIGEPGGENAEKYDDKLAENLRNLFAGGSSDLKQYFSTVSQVYKVNVNGEPHIKVQLGVKTTAKGDNKLSDAGITRGAVALYIPEARARGLWQGYNEIATPTGQIMRIPRYGALADIPRKLLTPQAATVWVDQGLSTVGKTELPGSLLTKYNLDTGYVSFAGAESDSEASVVISFGDNTYDGRIPLGNGGFLTKGAYDSNPVYYSSYIDRAIRNQLEKIKNQRVAKDVSDAALHRANYLQNPGNFVSVDDIPSA